MSRKANPDSETEHQKRVASALDSAGVLFCASTVDNIAGLRTRAKAVALGYRKGDPDLRIYDPPPAHPECFATALEMKAPQWLPKTSRAHRWSKCLPHQKERLAALEARGWLIIVAYGFDDAMDKLSAAGYPMHGGAGAEVAMVEAPRSATRDRMNAEAAS